MEPAADGEASEEVRHPAEDRRPDGQPGEQADEERDRDGPVDGPGGEAVPDDFVADDDVFTVASGDDGVVEGAVSGLYGAHVSLLAVSQPGGRLASESEEPLTSFGPKLR